MRFYVLVNVWPGSMYVEGPAPFPRDYDQFMFGPDKPEARLRYKIDEGAMGKVGARTLSRAMRPPGDILAFGVWSKALVKKLKAYGATGFATYPIRVTWKKKAIADYCGVQVVGCAGSPDLSRSELHGVDEFDPVTRYARGIYLKDGEWDRSDVFHIRDWGPRICVTEELAQHLKEAGIRHVEFVPNDECRFIVTPELGLDEQEPATPEVSQVLEHATVALAKRAIERVPSSPYGELLADRIAASVFIQATPVQRRLPLGTSRFGGLPDLPKGMSWPGEDEGLSPAFLAQIDLAEVARERPGLPLPKRGWLCFFYDMDEEPWGIYPTDRNGWRVVYFDRPRQSLRRAEPPEDYDEERESRLCRLSFESQLMVPSREAVRDPELARTRQERSRQAKLGDYPDPHPFNRFCAEIGCRSRTDAPQHRLLGHAQEIQGSMLGNVRDVWEKYELDGSDRSAARKYTAAKDWVLLLQLDSDERGPGWSWGDAGRMYFWIPRDDLRKRRFDRVWTFVQCY